MIKDLVRKCRSYRRFEEGHKVTLNTLKKFIELARCLPSARNQQALKFILSNKADNNERIFPALRWAGALKGWGGPKKGEKPAAYVVVLGDTKISRDFYCDHGIAAYGILLGAAEKGLGGCMIGAIDRTLLRKNLKIPVRYEILLVVAIGKPAEKVVIEDAEDGEITYYRDKKSGHHVPKRPLEELIEPSAFSCQLSAKKDAKCGMQNARRTMVNRR
ncbi:MAG: nitroreductase family protein [Candidatus Omnitrophica bacterium]|nr:nitroreductase family protein [Candidatus Omnitrophota bacterium]MBU1128887.1 nitroreductase family protein [Candidatus Omnitrophota bacterium]MBU1783847.1 nitroreductase family protein [Candidatus Omnitrophota bacterium]MBU1851566.1 nitroreductase family protein [Candidatus Omnitrophota bacterium]